MYMPSPNDDPGLLYVWQRKEKEYTPLGPSRLSALKRIAKEYSVSIKTVYYWLTPEYRAHKLESNQSESRKKQKRDWAKKPENRTKLSQYQRIRRNLPTVIEDLFLESGASTMSLEGLSVKLKQKTSFNIGRQKILIAIAKYNFENEERPIIEIEPELYKIDL